MKQLKSKEKSLFDPDYDSDLEETREELKEAILAEEKGNKI